MGDSGEVPRRRSAGTGSVCRAVRRRRRCKGAVSESRPSEIGDGEVVDAVDHARVTGGHGVEPTAATRASSGGAEFAAHGVEHVGTSEDSVGSGPSPTRVV